MTGSYAAAALVFLGLFLISGAYSFLKQGIKVGALVLVLLAGMSIAAGAMRW